MSTGMSQAANEVQEPLNGLKIDNQYTSRESIKTASPTIALSLLTIPTPPDTPSLSPVHYEDFKCFHLPEHPKEELLIPTSCTAIDIALRGGFPNQRITSLSSAHNAERSLLAMHAVASNLLTKPLAQAVWVDTEGGFSAAKLKEVIAGRLEDAGEAEVEMTVSSVLDRVQIYRVVDMEGLLEVLLQVRGRVEDEGDVGVGVTGEEVRASSDVERVVNDSQGDNDDEEVSQQETEKKVIQDSQEEDDGWSDDGGQQKRQEETRLQKEAVKIGLVVVDTISHLLPDLKFTPHFNSRDPRFDPYEEDKWYESEKPEAAALFVGFCRTFNLLAKDRQMCLLLLNDVTAVLYDKDVLVNGHELPPSRFHLYTGVKPALGSLYAEYMDLSVLLVKQPQDASMKSGDMKPQKEPEEIEGRETWVAEVLNDRYGKSAGRWGVFGVENARLIDV